MKSVRLPERSDTTLNRSRMLLGFLFWSLMGVLTMNATV